MFIFNRYAYTIKEANKLRDSIKVGQFVKFKTDPYINPKTGEEEYYISGFIKSISPNTFNLDNGRCYQWKQYLIGKEY